MRLKIFLLVVISFSFQKAFTNDVSTYLLGYRLNGVSNYGLEKEIIQGNSLEQLIEKLTPFFEDSLVPVRQKSYYLTYKRALSADADKKLAVNTLLNGCNDRDGGIVGQNLEFLKNFHAEDFDEKSMQRINSKLINHRIQHYKGFVEVAGFVSTGKDILYQKLLDSSVPGNVKWSISLAMARMGNVEQIRYCLDMIKKQPVNDAFVDYVLPYLIYMRQKEAIDYCVKVLNNNEKLCHSLNPDISESIICGYRVLELLAPIVVDLPVSLDSSGFLNTNDFEILLNNTRKWFDENPTYQIRKNNY
ncbi:MAG: hypothetical protein EHM93_19230 [Bacteroidales bacterium]|nr:MAG: hypothetical protein EHM93_19230 [Bacteroidales bacterium]